MSGLGNLIKKNDIVPPNTINIIHPDNLDNFGNITNQLSNTEININNTLYISRSAFNNDITSILGSQLNSNSYLKIKDRGTGKFCKVYLENEDLFIEAENGSNNTTFIKENEIDNIVSNIVTNPDENFIFSNIYLESSGQLTFIDETYYSNITHPNIGFRLLNGIIQFRNEGDLIWNNLSTAGSVVNKINDLSDVQYDTGTINNDSYLKWESTRNRFENVSLRISDDNIPTLSNTLNSNGSNILFSNNTGLIDSTSNLVLTIDNSNTYSNHILLTKINDGGIKEPVIKSTGSDTDIGLHLLTKGQGDLTIDLTDYESGGTTYGDLNIKASNINIQALNAYNYNSGFIKASMDFYTNTDLSTSIGSPQSITPITNNIIFELTGDDGRYYADLDVGVSGQELNVIFDTNGSNNSVSLSFSSSRLSVGTGLANKLIFNTSGQSCNLLYIQFSAYGDSSRNRWQVINTGAIVE